MPRVVVPTGLQALAWRRRLAETGGAIGVQVLTFDQLYTESLSAAGESYTELSDPVRYRLIRAIVGELPLTHYAPLVDRPGFIRILDGLMGELKAARVWPDAFAQAVAALGDEPRLSELALAYAAYQERLQAQGWADRAGLGWLAVEALEERAPAVAKDWTLLVVDGFDDFTPVQLALLELLATRVEDLIVTLTGTIDGSRRALVHRRFDRTRRQLQERLGVQAPPLPASLSQHAPPLRHLEAGLFCSDADQVDGGDALELIEAPDRAGEVRAALRWLKECLVVEGMRSHDVALLARDVSPYSPFILQTAAEFGLPVRLVDGLPLRTNPAVAAILDLLRLLLPSAGDPGPALPRRLVIEAWRSPYVDWSALPEEGAPEPIGIQPEDAVALDAVARWGRVIGGLPQWEEALTHLAARAAAAPEDLAIIPGQDEERGLPQDLPVGPEAQALWDKFCRFLHRLRPPQGERPLREFVAWLEALIGPEVDSSPFPVPEEPTALQVVARAREAPATAERDIAALRALKGVLGGLVWAEEPLEVPSLDFPRFYGELSGAVEAVSYVIPALPGREEILVADVVQARGVPFRTAAVVGLAEGEFPATLSEDAFLRDADRACLREESGLPLQPSTESAEAEFFYEAITRPRDRLLLTRPRLADNGALWPASPFWEEVRRLVDVTPQTLTSESLPLPAQAASWPELMESLAATPHASDVHRWVLQAQPGRQSALETAARLFRLREAGAAGSPHNGALSALAGEFSQRLGPAHTWSASRLESYCTCPFLFFVNSILGLEPRAEPAEGLDARQLGSIYHRILQRLYSTASDPTDLEELLQALPGVAQGILDDAPEREGFRATAWWEQTCSAILEDVRRSVVALAEDQGDFTPHLHEAFFGFGSRPPLIVRDGDDVFRLRGLIDRVDRRPDGRGRVIDYKTAGPWAYTDRALLDGDKIQLPLYALAARDALRLGEVIDGFYWHVRHAQASRFTMDGFEYGPEGAMALAVEVAWEVVRSARGGDFEPRPPAHGCPPYCPAAGFCWRYRSGFGG